MAAAAGVRRRVLPVTLAAVTAATWAAFAYLESRPATDASGRAVLTFWLHHTGSWWSGVCLAAASVTSLALAGWLLVRAVSSLPARLRGAAAAAGAIVWLGAAGYAAVLGVLAALTTGAAGTQTVVEGSGGGRVLITQDGFDGDVVGIWRPVTRHTYVREPGQPTVDPRSGRCRLDDRGPTLPTLTCGTTSQTLRRP